MESKIKYRHGLRAGGVLFLVVMFTGSVYGQARVKVHKDKITVSAIHEQGLIFVEGVLGAIETTSKLTSLVVRNLSTKTKVLTQRMDDGSFRAEIQGEPGDRIRVEARNQEGKRSIGTFDAQVPTRFTKPYTGWQTTNPVPPSTLPPQPDTPLQPGIADTPPARKAGARNLAVMIMVIDMGKGELIATERLIGVPRLNVPDEDLYQHTARNILHKCIDAVRSELKFTVGHDNYTNHIQPRYPSVPSKEKQHNVNPKPTPKEDPNSSLAETETKEVEVVDPKRDNKVL